MYAGMGNEERETSGINIIPLADVLLVLLIIFMVTAPVPSGAIAFDLPQTSRQQTASEPRDEFMLRIDAAGDAYLDGQLLAVPVLMEILRRANSDARAPIRLRIDASDEADYEPVAQVLAAAQAAGLRDIGFVD